MLVVLVLFASMLIVLLSFLLLVLMVLVLVDGVDVIFCSLI